MSVRLYHGRASTCSKKVRLALYEKGIAFDSRLIDLAKQEQKSPDYLALNAKGVVPTLVHDGLAVTESSVILEYIEDAFSGPPLRPEAAPERAAMRLWLRFSDEVAYPAIAGPTWKYMQNRAAAVRPAGTPVPEGKPRYSASDLAEADIAMSTCIAVLDEALTSRSWLVGDRFSLAEAAVLPFVDRIRNLRGDLVTPTACPAVTAWLDRATMRPAFGRAIDFTDDPRAESLPNI